VSSIACIVDCDIVPNQSAGKNQSIDTAMPIRCQPPSLISLPSARSRPGGDGDAVAPALIGGGAGASL
jgi:hypothetical protein